MKTPCLVLLTAVLLNSVSGIRVRGQQTAEDPREQYATMVKNAYGQDQELVNGRQYYNRHPLCKGSPHLFDGMMQQGSVTIRGERYDRLLLRYDIYNQQVEVEYRTINGARNQVVLVGDRIDAFTIGPLSFRNMMMEEGPPKTFQVAGYGNAVFYIQWEKKLIPLHNDTEFLEEYTASRNHISLKLGNELLQVRNRRQLNALLPEEIQKDVKRLFRTRDFNFRAATPVEMDIFLKEVSAMLNQGSA